MCADVLASVQTLQGDLFIVCVLRELNSQLFVALSMYSTGLHSTADMSSSELCYSCRAKEHKIPASYQRTCCQS